MYRRMICAIIVAAVVALPIGQARSDEPQFPNWKGQWAGFRVLGVTIPLNLGWDPTKAFGIDRQAPLTDQYQAVFRKSIMDQSAGGVGNFPSMLCYPQGMPAVMMAYQPLEFVATSDVTYILIDNIDHTRRIFTDGRGWPHEIEPTFLGYSIGKWIDEDGMAATTCWRSRLEDLKDPGLTRLAAYHCITTINPSFWKEFIWMRRRIRTYA